MDLSYLTNIENINYEDKIKEAIKEVKNEYQNLTTNQTCFIYSSLVCEKLKQKHIVSRIISTIDLAMDYEHRFVLVKEEDFYYIIDLTYNQFFNKVPDNFIKLENIGYQKVDKGMLNEYLLSISKDKISKDIDILFFK